MVELLLRTVDTVNPDDIYRNAKLYKRGDVVVACPDGWNWTKTEKTSPDFLILKVPDMTMEQAAELLAPEKDIDPSQPSRTLQRRGFRIDIDAIKAAPKLKHITDAKVKKTTVADPAVIANPVVIG